MENKDYLYFSVHDICTTVVATAYSDGLPVTYVVDGWIAIPTVCIF